MLSPETRVVVCLSQGGTSTSPRFHLRSLTVSQPAIWPVAVSLRAPPGGAGLPVGAGPFPSRQSAGAAGARGQEGPGRRLWSGLVPRRLTTLYSWFIFRASLLQKSLDRSLLHLALSFNWGSRRVPIAESNPRATGRGVAETLGLRTLQRTCCPSQVFRNKREVVLFKVRGTVLSALPALSQL